MNEADSSSHEKSGQSLPARIGWGALIVVTLAVCYFSNLGAIGFVGPDEPRYAWIARDMAESGDWVTPRLYGKPWFEKPVLYYWMAAASFKLFGVSEAAARLPSAVCALFATLALAWPAWRVYGKETARWLLLLLPTSVGMIGFSHAAATDMPFSGMLTIAMVCAAVALGLVRNENTPILPRTPWLALILFGFFLGLAVLAKGPAAIILSGGAVFFWALITKRWRDAFRLLHPIAILSFCATALPWYILCSRRNPDFFRIFIIEHNFKRYLTPEFQHVQPFWYYVPILVVALLPWSIAFASIVFRRCVGGIREWRLDHLQSLFWLAAILCVIFFSISKSKLPGCVLPAILLLGFTLAREFFLIATEHREAFLWTMYGSCALLFSAALLTGFAVRQPTLLRQTMADGLSAVLAALAIPPAAIACFYRRESVAANSGRAQILSSVIYWFIFVAAGIALRVADPSVSSRYLAYHLLETRSINLNNVRVYHLQRTRWYQLNFYFHIEIQEFDQTDREAVGVITSLEGAAELMRSGVRLGRTISGNGVTNEANYYEIQPATSAPGPTGSGQPR